jgi:K+-transporting ATPase ATPase C chain
MKRQLLISIRMTLATTVLLGVIYPIVITGIAQLVFRDNANGQLLRHNGQLFGSRIIGQQFSGAGYFHPRPSAAGDGYDAANSGATNFGTTNAKLVQRVQASVADLRRENPTAPIPVDLVTASGSGLDPDISPAAANFQVPRIAQARRVDETVIRTLVEQHTKHRQLGFLGEPRVSVLELNLALDARK